MLQWNIETEQAVSALLLKAETEWNKRKTLYERYRRKTNYSELVSKDDEKIKVGFEKYVTIVTTGYFAGKAPIYDVKQTVDEKKQGIIKELFKKVFENNSDKEELKILIDYISKRNVDGAEFFDLAFDYFCMNACYETLYENKDNEIIYARQSPLNTISIYDFETPVNLIGKLRKWEETDQEGNPVTVVELETKNGKRYYNPTPEDYKKLKEDKNKYEEGKWDDIPAIAIESEDGLCCFELVISLICAYERVIQNTRNTFQYNDEAKLMFTGFGPENPSIIKDEKTGKLIQNPARIKEDEYRLKSKTIYIPDGQTGNAKWLEKDVKDTALQNHKKTLVDLISMITGVPNITDLGFTNADNASALDRKFFVLEQMITDADKHFKKQFNRRWKLIIEKINKKKNKKYDYRDVDTKLNRNLPTDKKTETDRALSLKGTLSDETVLAMLPDDIDVAVELKRIKKQEEEDMNKFLENTKQEADKSNIEKEKVNEKSVSNMGQFRRTDLQENKTN